MINLFKKYFLASAIIFSGISCKKDSEKMIKIEVTEYKTNIPIAGARLDFKKSGDFDAVCICFPPEVFLSAQTDMDGVCMVSETNFNKAVLGIHITMQNYFDIWSQTPQTNYQMDFLSQVRIRLIKLNSYPNDAFMLLSDVGERENSRGGGIGYIYSLPSDSTANGTAFGGQTNIFQWKVFDHAGFPVLDSGFLQMDIPRTGISDIEIKY